MDLVLDLVTHGFSFVLFSASLGQIKFLLGFDLSFASHLDGSVRFGGKFLFNHCLLHKQFFVFSLLHFKHFRNSIDLIWHGHLAEPWLRDRVQLGGLAYPICTHIAGCSTRILLDQTDCWLDIVWGGLGHIVQLREWSCRLSLRVACELGRAERWMRVPSFSCVKLLLDLCHWSIGQIATSLLNRWVHDVSGNGVGVAKGHDFNRWGHVRDLLRPLFESFDGDKASWWLLLRV